MGKGTVWREQDPIVVRGFELYVELGSARKVATALAREGYKISHASVSNWIKKFGWNEKRARLLAAGSDIVEQYSHDMATGDVAINFVDNNAPLDRTAAVAVKNYYARHLFEMAEDFIYRFKKGDVSIDKFGDFDKAVKLIALLKGIDLTNIKKPASQTSNTINVYGDMSDEEVKKRIAQLRGE